jgi:hypothetical protein
MKRKKKKKKKRDKKLKSKGGVLRGTHDPLCSTRRAVTSAGGVSGRCAG